MKYWYSLLLMLLVVPGVINGQVSPVANPAASDTAQPQPVISFYADGNVQGMLESTENTSATGAIGLAIQNPYVFAALHVTAAATSENVTEGFGGRLLAAQGGGSFSGFGGSGRWLPRKWSDLWYGPRIYLQAASSNWVNGAESISAPLLGGGLAIMVEYRDSLGTGNPVSVMGDFGVAHRQLRGDLARSANDTFRETLLGTRDTGWTGIELGLTIQLHQISARGAYYHFGGDIQGFSNGQIVTSISVKSAIFSNGQR